MVKGFEKSGRLYRNACRWLESSIFVREGDGFAQVDASEVADAANPEEPSAAFRKKHKFKFLKWITTDSLEFVCWLPSGDVELKYYNLVATKEGGGFRSEINATVAIDSENRATLKKVSREETLEKADPAFGYWSAA